MAWGEGTGGGYFSGCIVVCYVLAVWETQGQLTKTQPSAFERLYGLAVGTATQETECNTTQAE